MDEVHQMMELLLRDLTSLSGMNTNINKLSVFVFFGHVLVKQF
jgi:hypothetical protein